MKKWISALLCLSLCLVLIACRKDPVADKTESAEAEIVVAAPKEDVTQTDAVDGDDAETAVGAPDETASEDAAQPEQEPPPPTRELVEQSTCGDYLYDKYSDGTVTITGYNGAASMGYSGAAYELHIPDELDGLRVTSIGEGAFQRCESLTSITIPESVVSIGRGGVS